MNFSPRFDPTKPVLELYEDGEWLRIESQQGKTRYLPKEAAKDILLRIGLNAVTEKSNIIVRV
jgi:hypothetical protein